MAGGEHIEKQRQQAHPIGSVLHFVFGSWRGWLLITVPAALVLSLWHVGGLAMFVVAAAAIVPLAALLGDATEEVSLDPGPLPAAC